MRIVPNAVRCSSTDRWPRIWCYTTIAAAGFVGWLAILTGLGAVL